MQVESQLRDFEDGHLVNFSTFIDHYLAYSDLISQLTEQPIKFDLGFDLDWLESEQWLNNWEKTMEQLENLELANLQDLQDGLTTDNL